MEKREVKTNWKELIKSFFSPDYEIEERNNEEEDKFNREYSDILAQSRNDISSLEKMLEHPDLKVKSKGRRTGKTERVQAKGRVSSGKGKVLENDEQEIER